MDLNESPGAYHGIAEGHKHLPPEERLALALKACDLYLARMTRIEDALEHVYDQAVVVGDAWLTLGRAVNALNAVLKGGGDADGSAAAEPAGTG